MFHKNMTYEEYTKAMLKSWMEDNEKGIELPNIIKKVLESSYYSYKKHCENFYGETD